MSNYTVYVRPHGALTKLAIYFALPLDAVLVGLACLVWRAMQ